MKDDRAALDDIRSAAELIADFIAGSSQADFEDNLLLQSAVIRQLEVMGEAVKRLSPDFRERHDSLPWSRIAGLRDRLIHAYDDVNIERIWMIATVDVPDLLVRLPRE